jgi:hypothetical protein
MRRCVDWHASFLGFKGSWLNRFEGTPANKTSVNKLPDFAVSHPRNARKSNPNLQSYIVESQNGIHYPVVYPTTSAISPQTISSFDLLYKSDW